MFSKKFNLIFLCLVNLVLAVQSQKEDCRKCRNVNYFVRTLTSNLTGSDLIDSIDQFDYFNYVLYELSTKDFCKRVCKSNDLQNSNELYFGNYQHKMDLIQTFLDLKNLGSVIKLVKINCLNDPDSDECKMSFVSKYISLGNDLHKKKRNESKTNSIKNTIDLSSFQESVNCFICQGFVVEIKKLLSNKTEKEIENELIKLCNYLRLDQEQVNSCKKQIEQYSALILHLIRKEFTPEEICETLKYCNNIENKRLLYVSNYKEIHQQSSEIKLNDSVTCILCKDVGSDLLKFLRNRTNVDRLKNHIQSICLRVFHNVDAIFNCSKTRKYVDEFVQHILAFNTTENLCSEFKLCNSVLVLSDSDVFKTIIHGSRLNQITANRTDVCQLCKGIFTHVHYMVLRLNFAKAFIKDLLDNVADLIGQASLKPKLDHILDTLYNILKQYSNSNIVCNALCPNTSKIESNQFPIPKPLNSNSSELCLECKKSVLIILQTLQDEKKFDLIYDLSRNLLCNNKSSFKTECESGVEILLKQALYYITNNVLTPQAICVEHLNICPLDNILVCTSI